MSNLLKYDVSNTNLLLFTLGNYAYAQKVEYPYKKYRDRKEGIIRKKQLVAAEKLVLISAAIENLESIEKEYKPNEYKLAFYLKESAKLKIAVSEFENYYKMQPLQEVYSPGPNHFSWPSEIPEYFNIALDDLLTLANIRGSRSTTIVPIVLYYEKPQNTDVRYRFSFIPFKRITLLEYNIYKLHKKEPIFTRTLRNIPRERITHIRWNGKDARNKKVSSGLFILNIKATFKSSQSSIYAKTVTLNYNFYHIANLFKNDLLIGK